MCNVCDFFFSKNKLFPDCSALNWSFSFCCHFATDASRFCCNFECVSFWFDAQQKREIAKKNAPTGIEIFCHLFCRCRMDFFGCCCCCCRRRCRRMCMVSHSFSHCLNTVTAVNCSSWTRIKMNTSPATMTSCFSLYWKISEILTNEPKHNFSAQNEKTCRRRRMPFLWTKLKCNKSFLIQKCSSWIDDILKWILRGQNCQFSYQISVYLFAIWIHRNWNCILMKNT